MSWLRDGSGPRCPICKEAVTSAVGIAAPMSDSGTEKFVPKLPIVLLDLKTINDGREEFISIVRQMGFKK